MDALSIDDPCWQVVAKKGNQTGFTEAMLNAVGYRIGVFPCAIKIVIPALEDAKKYCQRVDGLIQACPTLRDRIGLTEFAEIEGVDSTRYKTFPGGSIEVCGSASPATYRADPVCLMVLDDLDVFAQHKEGDHVELAGKRTNTFSLRGRKVFLISTPGEWGSSLIEREYAQSSQRSFYVPHIGRRGCGAFQVLERAWFRCYDKLPETAHFVCRHCGGEMIEENKQEMLMDGIWKAARPERIGSIEGFAINNAYSPTAFRTWSAIMESQLAAEAEARAGDGKKLRVHYNLDWGMAYRNKELVHLEGVEREVYATREPEFNPVALPLLCETAGVDVQSNRLELLRVGWGCGHEAWKLEHVRIKGLYDVDDTWEDLLDLLMKRPPKALCIDAGSWQDAVCSQTTDLLFEKLARAGCVVYCTHGREGEGMLWPMQTIPPGNIQRDPKLGRQVCRPVMIHVEQGKDWVYSAIDPQRIDAGVKPLHLDVTTTKNFVHQVFSERKRLAEDGRGRSKYVRVPGRKRNEALDLLVLARAALDARCSLDLQLRAALSAGKTQQAPPPAVKHPRRPRSDRAERPSWFRRRGL